jgi:NADPH2:quinone reductase
VEAIRLHAYGPAANLRLETLPDPVPGAGEVLIAVHAAGLHFIETLFRRGRAVGPHPAPPLPAVLGGEVAGVVAAAGEGVPADLVGRRVVTSGVTSGGYASLAVAPATSLAAIPDHVDFGAAAAMNTTGATAFGLLELAPLSASDVVLVTAAAGGVGTLLVQYARRAGARVIGAAGGPAKVRRAGELGADLAVDYRQPGWDKPVREAFGEVTVAFDGVGGELGRNVFGLLGRGGRHVVFGSAAGEWFFADEAEAAARGVTVHDGIAHLLGRDGGMGDLSARALEAAADGSLTPAVQAFPLARAAAAHEALESRDTMGKVILVP